MAKSRSKKRVKVKTTGGNTSELGPQADEVNYEEFLSDLYEKPFDPRSVARNKYPGEKYADYIEQLKDDAKQGWPQETAKASSPKRPAWKDPGLNTVGQRDKTEEAKDPTRVKFLEERLRQEAVKLGIAPEKQLDSSRSVRDFTMSGQLLRAVLDGRFFQVKSLLKTGVNIDAKNCDGYGVLVAALHIEDRDVREKMFRFLLKQDADCTAVDEATGRSVLAWACYLDRLEQVAKILQVSQGDLDFGHKDKCGRTVLHYAVMSGDVATVKMLVATMRRYGLSVDISDDVGLTPYLYSRKLGYLDICNVLLAEGRAARRQFDNKLFRSGTLWAEDGLRERQQETLRLKRVEKDWYKMNGRMPILERTTCPPGDSLDFVWQTKGGRIQTTEIHVDDKLINSVSPAPVKTGSSFPPLEKGIKTVTGVGAKCIQSTEKATVHDANVEVPNGGATRHTFALPPPPISSTYEPALALLAAVDQGRHVENFVGSVSAHNGDTKAAKTDDDAQHQQKGISSLLAVLSEQRSTAFRNSVRESPKELEPEPVSHKKHRRKTGVSSLAIIMGKDGKVRTTRRRGKSAKRKSPPGKKTNGPTRKISKVSRPSTKSTCSPESGHHVVRAEDLKTVKKIAGNVDNSSMELEPA